MVVQVTFYAYNKKGQVIREQETKYTSQTDIRCDNQV